MLMIIICLHYIMDLHIIRINQNCRLDLTTPFLKMPAETIADLKAIMEKRDGDQKEFK